MWRRGTETRAVVAATLLGALVSLSMPALSQENEAGWLATLGHGEWHFVPRYRFENVDDVAFADPARASTLRLRLNYRLPAWRGWSAFVEVDDVHVIGHELYNSTRNGETSRPTVPDPEGTELNQATLNYANDTVTLALGRQRMLLDDQRFIGPSSWRQNEQTMDAASARLRAGRAEFFYGYLANVNRTTGPRSGQPPGDLRSNSHLLNARIKAGALGSIALFAYRFDFDNAPALSSQSVGALWTGTVPLNDRWGLVHALSYAYQEEVADNPADYDADYAQLQLGVRFAGWTLLAAQERLSGDATRSDASFQTPLATLHIFQGWADKFAQTPPQGVEDTYASLSGGWPSAGVNVQVAWHRYAAEAVDRDYGREWNASISYRFATRYDLLLKAADYESRGFATDTTKLWLQFTATL